MPKTINAKIYSFFPAKIDVKTGEVELLENNWQWVFFRWLFWCTQFFVSFVDELPMFKIKIDKKEILKLSKEELNNLEIYEYK